MGIFSVNAFCLTSMNACGHAYKCAHATDETLNDQRMTPIAFQRSGIKAFVTL